MRSDLETFLRERTAGIAHTGRGFYSHLVGVYDLLKQSGASEDICLAGLFHSVYGTNAFKHQSVPLTERQRISDLIGWRAEMLAYLFCSCQRPRALVEAAKRGEPYSIVNWRDGERLYLLKPDLCALLEIEVANLQEQGSKGLPRVLEALHSIKEWSDA